ncbi:MAG: hypothetical protein U9R02_05505 [Thermodesulfobacteriota bacterium]|nr:hypothetical protein [Thermodesulfobacteriota bacterium]
MKKLHNQGIRTLIVDDDKALGDILKDLIVRDFVSVEAFSDAVEAIEFIKKGG